MTGYNDLTGCWSFRHPEHWKSVPKKIGDLIHEVRNVQSTFLPAFVHPTKQAAVAELREHLIQQRDQARADADFLSKPYTSSNGITHICPAELEDKWRAEVREKLAIAEAGLELLAAVA
jgi:hypothetical protein